MDSDLILLAGTFITFLGAVATAFVMVWREIQGVKADVQAVHALLTSKEDHAAGVKEEQDRDGAE